MSTWYPLDDSGDLWGLDDAPRIVVNLAELKQQKAELESKIKVEPDQETVDFWNQVHGDALAQKELEDLTKTIADIEAAKAE